jgi:phosphoribosylformimino-5-aminoimidazole carboxamide ribotide isomerase
VKFRPCIDLKNGRVVQIIGGTLSDADDSATETNFESELDAAHYARRYRDDGLTGGHVIALGPGNETAALQALAAFPGGLHYGGGVTPDNAARYLDAGASHVIVTSYVFRDGALQQDRLDKLLRAVGSSRLVLDLSCRWRDGTFWVVTDRWQHFSQLRVDAETLTHLSQYCAEFLVHGVDVEGRRQGIIEALVELLGEHSPIPATYAGGVRHLSDLDRVEQLGQGRVDLTIGSALDLFGGDLPYAEALRWHRVRNG